MSGWGVNSKPYSYVRGLENLKLTLFGYVRLYVESGFGRGSWFQILRIIPYYDYGISEGLFQIRRGLCLIV